MPSVGIKLTYLTMIYIEGKVFAFHPCSTIASHAPSWSLLQVFYDPHDLMASMVDANNLSYRMPESESGYAPEASRYSHA